MMGLRAYAQPVSIDSLTVVNPGCGASDGSIHIHASGGATGLVYSVDSLANTSTDSIFTNLAAGVYQIVVADSVGFSDTLTYTLYGTGGVSIDALTPTDITCFGYNDGMIDVIASGGSGPLSYELVGDTTQSTNIFVDLGPGNYTVVVHDTAFCVDTLTATINEPLEISFSSTTVDASCPATDGEIDILATGGDGSYMYSIDNGSNFQAGTSFTGLGAGIYSVVVMDGVGCTDTANVFVNSAAGFGPNILTLNFINPLCNAANDGSITVFATGVQPIVYSNDGGQNFQPGNTFTGLGPGTYDVMIEDANGCPVGSSITMVEPDVLEAGLVALDETCVGGNGSLSFTPTGGTPSYTYSIDSGATFTSQASYSPIVAGTYYYVVMDVNGCVDTGNVVINAGGGPTIQSIDLVQPTCPLDEDGSIVINALAQNGPISYSIDGGNVLFPTDSFPNLGVGVYDIVLVDADGCVTLDQVSLSGPGTPVADFSAIPVSGFAPLTVSFTDNSIGATTYLWDFGNGASDNVPNPSYTYTSSGSFTVIQTVSDGNCTDTASIVIEVIGDPSIKIPNIFTPNGDGINDLFKPEVLGIVELHGQIFNRYGALVYEWYGPEGWWDGFTAPAGQRCADGTYYYVISAVAYDGTQFNEKGFVTMVRQTPLK